MLNQLNELTKLARKYRRARESIPGVLFEITSNETGRKYLVNLDLRTCSCRAWQSTGYPCSHALSVILTRQLSVHDYTESFFTLDAFRKTYVNAIIPPSVSELGAMTTGPLPPPEPANEADESSDDEVEIEETTTTTKTMTRKRKVFYPPLSVVSQADRERREQTLKKSAGSVRGELSGVFRSADCAVPWDIRKGRVRDLLSSMLRDTKDNT